MRLPSPVARRRSQDAVRPGSSGKCLGLKAYGYAKQPAGLFLVGYQYSVFVLAHDVLYLADFQPHDSGCAVIAYDLKGGRPLWKTHLRGLPSPSHSQYYNRINLEVEDGHLIAYGNESIGRYIELLDLKTGEMVGQRLLGRPGEPNP